jgi:hypothetical protein
MVGKNYKYLRPGLETTFCYTRGVQVATLSANDEEKLPGPPAKP